MRIGLDITPATARPTGVGEYVLHTLEHLLPLLGEGDQVHGWSSGLHSPAHLPAGLPFRHIPVPTRGLYGLWRQVPFPRVDRLLGGLDVFHATNFFLPPTFKARRVLTVYDLAFLIEPRWASPKIVGPFSRDVPRFVREADAVITCSGHSRDDIVRLCGVSPERVHVAHGAADPLFVPRDREVVRNRVRALFGWDGPYVLYVGTIEPRKNLETLVRAFARIRGKFPHRLVLAGGTGWNMQHFPALLSDLHLEDRVVLPGYLPTRDDLAIAYSGADLFVLPSHYEGFGLPLVEAMACACPSVASNTASLPEVGGNAVRYFDPADEAALAAEMEILLGDADKRAHLAARGPAQAAQFNWTETAGRTLAVYRSLV